MIKCGAADSYLISRGGTSVLSRPSLPPGAGGDMPDPIDFYVRAGDRIIMASDGADIEPGPMLEREGLTSGDIVRERAQGSADDFTAIVITIAGADNKAE